MILEIFAVVSLAQDPALDRTSVFSEAYRACEQRADANVDNSFCLSDELDRQKILMREALRERRRYATPDQSANLDESQRLWEQSVEFDCRAEFEMGGSAAPARATACEIGLTMMRTDYLKIRGNW